MTNAAGVEFEIPGADPVTHAVALEEDTWHHLVVTVFYDALLDRTTIRLYRDGSVVVEDPRPGVVYPNPNFDAPMLIGEASAADDDFNPVRAYVDDVRIWNRALSAGEVVVLCEEGGLVCSGG